MPKIFDNIENHLLRALNQTLELSYKSDFCVGYFNLHGWKEVADKIDKYVGLENKQCRLSTECWLSIMALWSKNIINYDIKYRMGKELNSEEWPQWI